VQRIYYTNIHWLAKDAPRLTALLDGERRERQTTFCREEDTLRSLASGLLIRHIARGKPVEYTERGKPFVEGGPFFSVSHSGDYAAALVSPDAPVGIDIENTENERGAQFLSLANKAFHPEELRYFNRNPGRRRFYEIWTQKEAFVKMNGEGLSFGPRTFSVLGFSGSIPAGQATRERRTAYTRIYRDLEPYIIAVCSTEPPTVDRIEALYAASFS
jgi:4'-phosphopantetheinyl transferase